MGRSLFVGELNSVCCPDRGSTEEVGAVADKTKGMFLLAEEN